MHIIVNNEKKGQEFEKCKGSVWEGLKGGKGRNKC